jgi:hypothetical protein
VTVLPRRCWLWRDVATKATWPWCDVGAEATWPSRDVSAESCYAIGVGIYDQSRDVQPGLGCTYIISMYNG